MLSKLRARFWTGVLPGLLAAAGAARAQAVPPDTLVLPAMILSAPAPTPLPLEGLPTSSRGARGASWSVDDRELTVGILLEKVLRQPPAEELPPAEIAMQRLLLVEQTRQAFADYYQGYRQLEQIDEGLRRMQHCRAVADRRRREGAAPGQDVFQADVELGKLCERRVDVEKRARVACARLNRLLQRPPEAALPPPPAVLPPAGELPEVWALQEAAVARRPDLQALRHWLQRERKELPATAAAGRGAAELKERTAQVRCEVEATFAEVRACEKSAQLLQEAVLRAAATNAAAAENAYTAGRVPFLSWVEAERNLVEAQLRRHEVLAEYHRRRAALARAIADPPGHTASAPPPPFREAFHERVYPAAHLTQPAPR